MKIKHLLFDCDNTLYPCSSAMDEGITRRMLECVAEFFNCPMEEAVKIRHQRIAGFSTTLEWLRSEGLTDIEKFLAHVHPESEAQELPPQPDLREFLQNLPYKKTVLTNAPHEHCDNVLKLLNVFDQFDCVTDIRDTGFYGKPYPDAFLKAVEKAGSTIEETIFIDDMIKYVDGWKALGGTAILVGTSNGHALNPDSKPMQKINEYVQANNIKPGKIIKLNSIYELPDLLKNWE